MDADGFHRIHLRGQSQGPEPLFSAPGAKQLQQFPPECFLAARQQIEFCRIIGLSQDFLPLVVLIHVEEDITEAFHGRLR
jgi:hypothetical protein